MRALYLDCFAGISGDMMLGALLDLGLELEVLEVELSKLPIAGYELQAFPVNKNGIQATQFQVSLLPGPDKHIADAEFMEVDPQEEDLPLPAGSSLPQSASHPHRPLSEILELVAQSSLSEGVKAKASAVFKRLGEAEAKVHGVPFDQVYLHELGGTDAIIDIVGTVIGIEQLGIEQMHVSPLPLGSGFVRSAHGVLPVPAPATAALLQGVPVYSGPGPGELVTPTGAAIVVTLAKDFGPMPQMWVSGIGYGSGTRQRAYPNVLRAFLGEMIEANASVASAASAASGAGTTIPGRNPFPEQHAGSPVPAGYHESPALVIEANLDDMNPQFFDPLVNRLLEAGALDVTLIPVQMKKNRPGVLLQVLAYPTSLNDLLSIIFTESSTIGARSYPVIKHMLQRENIQVETPYGTVNIKIAYLGERVVTVTPEFEDCRRLAEQAQVPIKEVYALALSAYHQRSLVAPN